MVLLANVVLGSSSRRASALGEMALAAGTCKGTAEAALVAGLLVGVRELVAARVAVRSTTGVRVGANEGDDFGWGVAAGVLGGDGSLISASSMGEGSDADWNDAG